MDNNNTVAEIKAYLDENQIAYSSSATKTDLLALIPVAVPETEIEPEQQPVVPVHREPYYTKAELLGLITGYMHDYFFIALENGRTYTYKEALQSVDDWKHSGTIF